VWSPEHKPPMPLLAFAGDGARHFSGPREPSVGLRLAPGPRAMGARPSGGAPQPRVVRSCAHPSADGAGPPAGRGRDESQRLLFQDPPRQAGGGTTYDGGLPPGGSRRLRLRAERHDGCQYGACLGGAWTRGRGAHHRPRLRGSQDGRRAGLLALRGRARRPTRSPPGRWKRRSGRGSPAGSHREDPAGDR